MLLSRQFLHSRNNLGGTRRRLKACQGVSMYDFASATVIGQPDYTRVCHKKAVFQNTNALPKPSTAFWTAVATPLMYIGQPNVSMPRTGGVSTALNFMMVVNYH